MHLNRLIFGTAPPPPPHPANTWGMKPTGPTLERDPGNLLLKQLASCSAFFDALRPVVFCSCSGHACQASKVGRTPRHRYYVLSRQVMLAKHQEFERCAQLPTFLATRQRSSSFSGDAKRHHAQLAASLGWPETCYKPTYLKPRLGVRNSKNTTTVGLQEPSKWGSNVQ